MPHLLNPLRYPGVAMALWSHKILRWLTPFFLIMMLFTANLIPIWDKSGGMMLTWAVNAFFLLGLIGGLTSRFGMRLPVVQTVYHFFLANAGFLVGVILALGKRKIHVYRS